MRNLIKYFALILVFNINYAQNKEIDSLIQKIDNKDAYIVLTKTVSPRINGKSANRIVEIGKVASPKLIKILESPSKGIAAHFMLSKIWQDIWSEEVCCNITTIGKVEVITINGLEIQIENNMFYATPENLKKERKIWEKLCQA